MDVEPTTHTMSPQQKHNVNSIVSVYLEFCIYSWVMHAPIIVLYEDFFNKRNYLGRFFFTNLPIYRTEAMIEGR